MWHTQREWGEKKCKMQNTTRKRSGVKMWQSWEGDRWVLKGGIIHNRESVEKTDHTREIENVKAKPPHKKD
jgi:hypothetical protein